MSRIVYCAIRREALVLFHTSSTRWGSCLLAVGAQARNRNVERRTTKTLAPAGVTSNHVDGATSSRSLNYRDAAQVLSPVPRFAWPMVECSPRTRSVGKDWRIPDQRAWKRWYVLVFDSAGPDGTLSRSEAAPGCNQYTSTHWGSKASKLSLMAITCCSCTRGARI